MPAAFLLWMIEPNGDGIKKRLRSFLLLARALPSCVGGDAGRIINAMKEYATKFYSSKAWKDCRRAYAKSVRGLCERCLAKGIYRPGEIVHHKIHINPENISDLSVILDWSNLELLCRECHGMEHSNKEGARLVIDDLGRVIF